MSFWLGSVAVMVAGGEEEVVLGSGTGSDEGLVEVEGGEGECTGEELEGGTNGMVAGYVAGCVSGAAEVKIV